MEQGTNTPVFEFCSPAYCVKMVHVEEQMVLIACRERANGSYMEHSAVQRVAQGWGVPVVRRFGDLNGRKVDSFPSLRDMSSFVNHSCNIEGVVVLLPHGIMIKMKTRWWRERRQEQAMRLSGQSAALLSQQQQQRRQQLLGHHKTVRALLKGALQYQNLMAQARLFSGVVRIEMLCNRVSGTPKDVFLVFKSPVCQRRACQGGKCEGVFLIPAKSNRIHGSEKFVVKMLQVLKGGV